MFCPSVSIKFHYELHHTDDLDSVKLNECTKYVHLVQKLLLEHTDRHTLDRLDSLYH